MKFSDKVRYTGTSKDDLTDGKVYKLHRICGDVFVVINDVGDESYISTPHYELVTDAPQAPTLLRDMTDAEKGALLLAKHQGKVIECWHFVGIWVVNPRPTWLDGVAYRVAEPEPKEPREVWIVDGSHVYTCKSAALQDMADFQSKEIALFREVMQ